MQNTEPHETCKAKRIETEATVSRKVKESFGASTTNTKTEQ